MAAYSRVPARGMAPRDTAGPCVKCRELQGKLDALRRAKAAETRVVKGSTVSCVPCLPRCIEGLTRVPVNAADALVLLLLVKAVSLLAMGRDHALSLAVWPIRHFIRSDLKLFSSAMQLQNALPSHSHIRVVCTVLLQRRSTRRCCPPQPVCPDISQLSRAQQIPFASR